MASLKKTPRATASFVDDSQDPDKMRAARDHYLLHSFSRLVAAAHGSADRRVRRVHKWNIGTSD